MESLMQKVKSSNLEEVGYDKENKILYIRFIGGGLYSYHPVSRGTFHRFQKAESKGKFFHQHIKSSDHYKVQKVEG